MTEDLDRFRAETREWLAANCPAAMREPVRSESDTVWGGRDQSAMTPDQKLWMDRMAARGWTVPDWPTAYGGGGLSPAQTKILREEMRALNCRIPLSSFGISMLGPALLKYGSEEQKLAHLPPIARGEIRWCQGYSEPNAGSDLANLQCFAQDQGDHYLVNGQKTWTSGGQWADKCFCLVRTDRTQKQGGITFLLIDMDSPGVEVKPIAMISGMSPFCETFFTDVRVPKGNRVGEEGQGWTIGKRLLQHERTNLSGGGSAFRLSGPSLADLAKTFVGTDERGRIADGDLRARIAKFEMDWRAFLLTAMRVQAESRAVGGVSEVSSILKTVGTRLGQERAELLIEIQGHAGLGWAGEGFTDAQLHGVRAWLFGKATTIYGGSTEIQNNVIAKRILGMLDHQ